jgi:hypothetical protein
LSTLSEAYVSCSSLLVGGYDTIVSIHFKLSQSSAVALRQVVFETSNTFQGTALSASLFLKRPIRFRVLHYQRPAL